MPNDTQCESCVWYDTDPWTGEPVCNMDMDEDERSRRMQEKKPHRGCPYYKYYNEYKSVQRQN